jgi:hypothetical protein
MAVDESGANPRSESRTPYWLVGLALLAVVVILLVAAFLLNEHLRSNVGVQPLTPSSSKKGGSPPKNQSGTALPPRAFPTPAVTRSPTLTPRPTPTPTARQQVTQAYYRYWRGYNQALYTLDTSLVGQVAADGELHRIEAEVAGFRRQNYAVRVRVTHHALIVSVKGDTATIYDEVLNRSFAIDPVTKQPGQGSNRADRERNIYTLKRIGGVWKVTELLRQQG